MRIFRAIGLLVRALSFSQWLFLAALSLFPASLVIFGIVPEIRAFLQRRADQKQSELVERVAAIRRRKEQLCSEAIRKVVPEGTTFEYNRESIDNLVEHVPGAVAVHEDGSRSSFVVRRVKRPFPGLLRHRRGRGCGQD